MSAARLAAGALAVLAAGCVKRTPDGQGRDVVVVAGRVRTNDPQRPLATALVVRGERVAFVGDEAGALAFASSDALVDRFPGATVVPGLGDAHGHLASLGRSLSIVSLEGMTSAADVGPRLARAPRAAFQGEWLMGRGWDQNDWVDKAFPSKALLDAAQPGVPVFLTRVDGHAAWVSSAALARAGITRDTKDPPGGRIVRDATGEPTGVLVDNAIDLVSAKLPAPSQGEREGWLKAALELCARLGLTAVHDAGMDEATFELLQRWDLGGLLPVRVYVMADGQSDGWERFVGRGVYAGGLLELRAVKLLADGALGSRGAALLSPYRDEPASHGLLLLEPDELARRARAFDARGFQVAVHAIGDRANALVIDVLSTLTKEHRHRVEHAQVLRAADVERMAKAGLVASMQPTHATSDMPWAEARLGPERLALAYAWRAMLDAKVPLAFGSDFPVEHPNPLWGLYAARTRQDQAGAPAGGWTAGQRLTGQEALEAFTTGVAYAAHAEARRGRLSEGFDADFVVLPVDPVEGDPRALLDAEVLMTVVRGVDVYRAAAAGAAPLR
ncbi:MAG: amidohydrolase [Myxococcaceae bacterium]|nr:amidohydrolase [Myxococcaceae bacterium]